MNVKRYRAATMRDALEKVKSELGEEALVLGSKSVRRRGFLGFGAKEMVEVRVSTEFANPTSTNDNNSKNSNRRSNFTSLSLADTTPMMPAKPETREQRKASTFSTLAARAYHDEARSTLISSEAPKPAKSEVNNRLLADLVEAASTSPVRPPAPVETFETVETAVSSPAPTKRDSLLVEIDRLRAEVREVKFTLTNRPTQHFATGAGVANFDDSDADIYDSPYYETYLHLAGLGLTPEIARTAVRAAIDSGSQSKNVRELAQIGLVNALPSLITFGSDPLAQATETNILSNKTHPIVAVVGPTGVGKTTTIAKLAARAALRERKRVELITLDTYRIAAVEQLRTYAEIIGAGFHVPRSVLELNALVEKFSGQATVLIDTIGRSARDLADQLELADYLRSNNDIVKCLAIQATTHPADATLAIDKFALFGIDQLVITKLDETGRPAAAISTAAAARLPLAYLCTGQRVPEDIERATAESLAAHALQTTAAAIAA